MRKTINILICIMLMVILVGCGEKKLIQVQNSKNENYSNEVSFSLNNIKLGENASSLNMTSADNSGEYAKKLGWIYYNYNENEVINEIGFYSVITDEVNITPSDLEICFNGVNNSTIDYIKPGFKENGKDQGFKKYIYEDNYKIVELFESGEYINIKATLKNKEK